MNENSFPSTHAPGKVLSILLRSHLTLPPLTERPAIPFGIGVGEVRCIVADAGINGQFNVATTGFL